MQGESVFLLGIAPSNSKLALKLSPLLSLQVLLGAMHGLMDAAESNVAALEEDLVDR